MKTVKFIKPFTIIEDGRTTLTYPEGWTGEVEDDLAAAAKAEGCIETKAKPKVKKAEDATDDATSEDGAAADADTPPA